MKEAQSYMSVLMLLPMIPTIVLMVNPVKNQLWMLTVPFLAQNQMILKLVRSEAISMTEWAAYLAAGFGAGAGAVVAGRAPLPRRAAGDLGLSAGDVAAKKKARRNAGPFFVADRGAISCAKLKVRVTCWVPLIGWNASGAPPPARCARTRRAGGR